MKIAFDGKRFFNNASGLGNYSRDLVRILAENFPENQYVLLNDRTSDRGTNVISLDSVTFHETSKGIFSRQLKMGVDAQSINADIFHGLSGELPLKWNSRPIKKIVTIHDLIFLRYPKFYPFFDRKIHLWKFKKACHEADIIIAISQQTKNDIIEFLKVPEDKIVVVYQGCHQTFKKVKSSAFHATVTSKYKLPQRFILNVGTIEERKNLLNIVKAITNSDIHLVVVGKKTKYYRSVEKYVLKHKLAERIHFLEGVTVEELSALYQMADIFVYPSVFEGFGIPVIEALFSRTPVITSNVSSLPEAGGPGALYINSHDVEDLSAKIIALWENQEERVRRAEIGLQYAQKFTDIVIAENLLFVYQSVINK